MYVHDVPPPVMPEVSSLSVLSGTLPFSPLFFFFQCHLSGCQGGGVGHVYAEEEQQGLTVAVAYRDPPESVVLFLIAEAPLHYRGAESTDNAAGDTDFRLFVLRFGSLTHKICDNALFGAIAAVLVVGVDGVHTNPADFHAHQRLPVFNALFQARTFVEGSEGVVLDEGDAVNLYIVDLGAELDAPVLLASYYGCMAGRLRRWGDLPLSR